MVLITDCQSLRQDRKLRKMMIQLDNGNGHASWESRNTLRKMEENCCRKYNMGATYVLLKPLGISYPVHMYSLIFPVSINFKPLLSHI